MCTFIFFSFSVLLKMDIFSSYTTSWLWFSSCSSQPPRPSESTPFLPLIFHLSSLMTCMMYSFALHYIVELHLWKCHREKNCQRTSCEVPVDSCCFCGLWPVGEPHSFYRIKLLLLICVPFLLSRLDCSCWLVSGVCYWTELKIRKICIASKNYF